MSIVPRIPFEIGELILEDPAHLAGLQPGDRVTVLNGKEIHFWDQFLDGMKDQANKSITLTVMRDGEKIEYTMALNDDGLIGVRPRSDTAFLFEIYEEIELKYNFFQAIPAGINKGSETTRKYLKSLEKLFKPKKYKAHESLGGFITIGSIFPSTWNWQSFWNLTAFLSIMLAIMNLLPIPALDGGHVMFLLFEIVSGRKPGDKFMEYAQIVGMVLLMALLLYANLNDVIGLFKK
jgi:regulator of sigma E protease